MSRVTATTLPPPSCSDSCSNGRRLADFDARSASATLEAVGERPPPSDPDWRDQEFKALNIGPFEKYVCKFAWALELRENGWPREQAEAMAILYTFANGALSRGVREGSRAFAASTYAIRDALGAAALRQGLYRGGHQQGMHEPLYANLRGRGGLATEDPRWEEWLLSVCGCRAAGSSSSSGGSSEGSGGGSGGGEGGGGAFLTSAIALAAGELTRAGIVWAGQPHAARAAAGVVCFRAAPADATGLHALVDVGSGRYALPPLSRVSLVRVDEPGEWEIGWLPSAWEARGGDRGDATRTGCRLYTVCVTWV